MKLRLFRIITILLTVGCMCLIFCFSAQNAEESSAVSGGLTNRIFSVIIPGFREMTPEQQAEMVEKISFPVRKTAHFSIYSLLGLCAFLSVVTYRGIPFYLRPALSWAVCILYASGDEFHQRFIPGRSGEVRDVIIDSCGALLATVLAVLVARRSNKIYPLVKDIRGHRDD